MLHVINLNIEPLKTFTNKSDTFHHNKGKVRDLMKTNLSILLVSLNDIDHSILTTVYSKCEYQILFYLDLLHNFDWMA